MNFLKKIGYGRTLDALHPRDFTADVEFFFRPQEGFIPSTILRMGYQTTKRI